MGNCDKNSLKKIAAVSTLTSTASYISLVILALYINTYVSLVLTAVVIAIPSIIRAFSGFFLNNLAKIIKKKNSFCCLYCYRHRVFSYILLQRAS